ncbi:unnamed protein product [Hymenolepis diminuta]|uniref:Integrase catalytic domain-containing protein n=1 Tax=Hymenolepis diminuta TaxID=6216 RepID=A0A564Y1X8_HYMDI|nr:unnamed protein product [Hymenolepis diminuta]
MLLEALNVKKRMTWSPTKTPWSKVHVDFAGPINGVAPYYPQSNGCVELFADTYKMALVKGKGEGSTKEAIQKSLLTYRTNPHPTLCCKWSAGLLVRKTLRIINKDMILKEKTNKLARSLRRGVFAVGELVNYSLPELWPNERKKSSTKSK